MYGLVNRSLQDFICQEYGESEWESIKKRAHVNVDVFVSMEAYPDEITYQLVGAASEHLTIDPSLVLHAFGRHWVLVTGKEGYGEFLNLAGDTLPEFLNNLNNLHTRVALAFQSLRPPEFNVIEDNGESLRLQYISPREGLAPFVLGLLDGLGELFCQDMEIEHTLKREDCGHDEFLVRYQPQTEEKIIG